MRAVSHSTATKRSQTRRPLALVTLCFAVLVAQIDTAVVNLATRPIGDYFQASIGDLQWVVDGYNLAYAVMLLSGGLFADLFGRRRVFVYGAAVFTLTSFVCAFAPSISILIGARTIAGLGAAFMIPASLAIIRVLWRDATERGRALGIWAACNGLALAIGPTLGGLLIPLFGWRSIFLVVVPVSAAAMLLAYRSIPETADPQHRNFDALAQCLGALALGCLAFAAIEAEGAPSTAAVAFIMAIIAFILFLRTEARQGKAALVPLDLFRSRAFAGAMTATASMTFGMYGVIFLVPLNWQSSGVLSVSAAGLALMPMALVFVIVSPLTGWLGERLESRTMTAGGVAIIASGLLVVGLSAGYRSLFPIEIGLALTGLGMGFATGPLMATAVGAVDAARSGTASALINVARMTGATIGVATLGAVYAIAQRGAFGLQCAMLFGAAIQLAGAAVAWLATPARNPPQAKSLD